MYINIVVKNGTEKFRNKNKKNIATSGNINRYLVVR
jgi:hypothetical protein